jgi:hypothetical protein
MDCDDSSPLLLVSASTLGVAILSAAIRSALTLSIAARGIRQRGQARKKVRAAKDRIGWKIRG